MQALGAPPEDLGMLCDVAQALYLVNSAPVDSERTILHCLEIFDDLVRATRLSMPPSFQQTLSEFTDHLTRVSQLWRIPTRHQHPRTPRRRVPLVRRCRDHEKYDVDR